METGFAVVAGDVVGKLTDFSIETVRKKIEVAKQKKDIKEQQIAYEEIINELLEERLSLERTSRYYMELYQSVTITDEDIEYLHNTLIKLVDILGNFDANLSKDTVIKPLISLLDKDLLKTMQLLGFSYKEAIGKPLTEVVSKKILSWGNAKVGSSQQLAKRK